MKQISFETVFFFEYGIYYSKMDFYQGGNRMKRTIRIGIVYCILTSLVTACSSVSANASNTTLINVSKNQASTEIEESVSLSGNDKVTPAASVENPSSRNLYFYVSALADDAKLYSSVDELSNDADLIITGKVVNQENYFHMDMIYQLAFVKVESVRKGGFKSAIQFWFPSVADMLRIKSGQKVLILNQRKEMEIQQLTWIRLLLSDITGIIL